MVHFSGTGSRRRRTETAAPVGVRVPVKIEEVEEAGEDGRGGEGKRIKMSLVPGVVDHQLNTGRDLFPVSPAQYNPLDEPSPLGLRLRKSPSLLELIQIRLSPGSSSKLGSQPNDDANLKEKSATKGSSNNADKLKAANFPASILKIGDWEYASKHEGDLVGKCYFAKHKLVWEILEGGLKSKIEIQWSDIMGLKANISEDGPATLTVVLARQPLFFRETNPQPRKHTLWQATADFTDGNASLHRQHFLQVPHGLLNKHFEKLIQCDARLNFLSRQPEIVLDSPYFDAHGPVFTHPDDAENLGLDPADYIRGPNITPFQDMTSSMLPQASPMIGQASPMTLKQEEITSRQIENVLREAPSPSSVMDMRAMEAKGSVADCLKNSKNWEQLIRQGLRPSMSMSDMVNHIGNCIWGQTSSQTAPITNEGTEARRVLEDIAQHLLGDSQSTADEKFVMSRVNSLACLLQDNDPANGVKLTGERSFVESEGRQDPLFFHNSEPAYSDSARLDRTVSGLDGPDFSGFKPAPAMSRKDSFSDLLLSLPRIASLPRFLHDISEDGEGQER